MLNQAGIQTEKFGDSTGRVTLDIESIYPRLCGIGTGRGYRFPHHLAPQQRTINQTEGFKKVG